MTTPDLASNPRTILITGGAGFIGSALVRHLIRHSSDRIINLDKLTYAGNLESLTEVAGNPRYRFEHVDICNRREIERVFREHQPDAIMHLAAESHVDRSIDGAAPFIETNVVGTCTLLEVSREYCRNVSQFRADGFRFLHVSTDEVYGDLGESSPPFSETAPYAPSSPYAASKASADHLVRAWRRTHGLPTLITNCSNNYGPYQFPEKLIPLMILNALEGKSLPVYGQGDQIRDWLYVEDHVRALVMVLNQGLPGETYNIGGGNQRRNIDVVRKICTVLDELRPRKRGRSEDLVNHVTDRPGHDRRYAIDSSKIEREIGWHPTGSFDVNIRSTVKWYLENGEWCQRIQDRSYQRQRLGLSAVADRSKHS